MDIYHMVIDELAYNPPATLSMSCPALSPGIRNKDGGCSMRREHPWTGKVIGK
jgi:hypothetical protein